MTYSPSDAIRDLLTRLEHEAKQAETGGELSPDLHNLLRAAALEIAMMCLLRQELVNARARWKP